MKKIDINCDLGEGSGNDEELLKYITSANIACGFHAGDYNVMANTVKLALQNGVAIGAHPGFPDLEGFGRREMHLNPMEVYNLVVYQVGAIAAFCQANSVELSHVKPHGALYNMAAKNPEIAEAIVKAVAHLDHGNLILYGPSGSELIKYGKKQGLLTASEVFADRTYQKDGSLTPRSSEFAVHKNAEAALEQALLLIKENKVRTIDGEIITLEADTICVHGDNPAALDFVKQLKARLASENITTERIK